MRRSTRLEIDLDRLGRNFLAVKKLVADVSTAEAALSTAADRGGLPRTPRIAAVLKADAYGFGAVTVARELAQLGADMFTLACLPEALQLARALPAAGRPELLVMGHTPDEYLPELVDAGIGAAIYDAGQAALMSRAAVERGVEAVVHIKVDTGLHRLGLMPGDESAAFLDRVAALPALRIEGIFSHLAYHDRDADKRQFDLFTSVVEQAQERGLDIGLRHICDSIGLMRYPEFWLDMLRIGAILYGVKPRGTALDATLHCELPAQFKTRVSRIRSIGPGEYVGYDESYRAPAHGAIVGTLPVGYADGYMRCLSNKGRVLIRGKRAPVLGLVCMDQLCVDLSSIPQAREGDEALLFGEPGGAGIGIGEYADWGGLNRNEALCSIGRRVPRLYTRGGTKVGELDYLG